MDPSTGATDVQQALAAYRENLYGGRGPGISETDWLANTSLRRAVAGMPTATSREELHLRTLRARGRRTQAAQESRWAAAQFRTGTADGARPMPSADVTAPGSHGDSDHRPSRLAVLAVLAAAWLRAGARRSPNA